MFDWEGLRGQLHKLASVDPTMCSDAELQEIALGVEGLRPFLDAASLHAVGELEARGTTDVQVGLATCTWLAREAGLPLGMCTTRVKVARRLRAPFTSVDEALVEGRITYEHARVITEAANPRIVDALAVEQDDLIDGVEGTTFGRWAAKVTERAELLAADGGYDPGTDEATNELHLDQTPDGVTHVSGKLVGEAALICDQAINDMADELFRRYTEDAKADPSLQVPKRSTLKALAFAELCRRALATPIGSSKAPAAEAIYLIHPDDPPHGLRTLDGRLHLDRSYAAMRCAEQARALILDPTTGVPLALGRRIPLASPGQRRTLAVRDGGCVFPGCTAPPSWCDAHHVTHRTQHGPTDTDNLALLCRRHHGVTHRRGWTMTATADQWFWWTTPNATTFWSQRHGHQRNGPTPDGPAPPPHTE